MKEVIKYFESLEARIAGSEARLAALEARIEERTALLEQLEQHVKEIVAITQQERVHLEVMQNALQRVIENGGFEASAEEIEEPIEIEEPVVTQPVAEPEPIVESEPVIEPTIVPEEPEEPEEPKEPEVHVAEPEAPKEPEVHVAEPEKEEEQEEVASPKAALYGKAVTDIRQAISLGDRFLYQRELFGQNAELMQRTLLELNELNSFEEAIAYIRRFEWDTESSTYQQFLVTLHRRFG